MRRFKIFVYKNAAYRILLTDFSSSADNRSNLYSTFNETLSISENDQATLTFSMMRFIHNISHAQNKVNYVENSHYKLLTLGAKVELQLDDKTTYLFIITGVKPTVAKDNIRYDYTCQDEISYSWSRRSLGLSYNTMDYGGVQTIYDIVNQVLTNAQITEWRAKPNEYNETALDTSLYYKKITLDIADSNPYNIIVEACNTLNAYLSVDYNRKILSFYQRDKVKFSGYRYRTNVNLKQLNIDYSISNMCTMLHVYGGVDEYGLMVNLFPPLDQQEDLEEWWIQNHMNFVSEQIDFTTAPGRFLVAHEGSYSSREGCVWKWKQIDCSNGVGFYWTGPDGAVLNAELIVDNVVKTKKYTLQSNAVNTFWSAGEISSTNLIDIQCSMKGGDVYDCLQLDYPSDFYVVAEKVPHLGNFLCDFSFFKDSQLLSNEDYNNIMAKFNIEMAYNNMWLKVYEPKYYKLYYQLGIALGDAKNTLNIMQSAILNGDSDTEAKKWTEYETLLTQIKTYMQALYNQSIYTGALLEYDKPVFTVDILQNLVDEYRYYHTEKEYALTHKDLPKPAEDDALIAAWLADKAYYIDRYYSLITLVGLHDEGVYDIKYNPEYDINQETDYNTNPEYITLLDEYTSTYYQLISDLISICGELSSKDTIDTLCQFYKTRNDAIWATLYNDYGQYIYEGRYDNPDEMNSFGLYNQAMIYFKDICRPSGNFSIAAIDLTALELVATPQLKVGSKIKIYDELLNLSDNVDTLSEIQYGNNDLIVTSLNYNLRSPADLSIGVSQVQLYLSVVQKLIQNIK